MESDDKYCNICESEMKFDGYDKDWGVWVCLDCESKKYTSIGQTNKRGFTMESLGNISDFTNDT